MKKFFPQLLSAVFVALLCIQAVLFAADSTRVIKFEDAPEEAQTTMKKQAGKAKIIEVSKVTEDGQTFFEAKFGTEAKHKIMRVAADGKLMFRQFYFPETPPAVRKAISQQVSGGKIKRIVKTFGDDGSTFEVQFNKRGKDREFVLSAEGSLLSRQLTMAETPAPVQKTIRKEMGKGELVQILKTVDEGETYFQVDIVKEKETQQRTLNIALDGTLTSIQVFAAELPAKVQKTIFAELRGGKVDEIYKTLDDDGTTYELDIVRRDKTYSMSVDADGTLIEVEMELADTPADVQKVIKAQIGDAEVDQVTKSIEAGEVIYVAEYTRNEKTQSVSVAADGRLLDQEMEISLADAPAAVQKTIKEQAGKAEVDSVTKVIVDGEIQYEAEISDDHRSFVVTVADDGELLSVEEDIQLSQAPSAVQKTINEKIGSGKLTSLTKATEDKDVFYDVEATTKDGAALIFSVDPTGKYLGKRE